MFKIEEFDALMLIRQLRNIKPIDTARNRNL